MTPRRAPAIAGLMLGLFLSSLDSTIMSAAMPTIIRELGGLAHYHWVFAAYLLMTTVTTPLWGRLADLYGRRRFFTLGVILFMAGSAWAGAATSMETLIAARALQGLGAGGIMTLAFSMMAGLFPPEKRGASVGFLSAVWTLSSIVGPQAGGLLAQHGHWRWCFYINLPSGALALLLIHASGVTQAPEGPRRKPDFLGALLLLLASLSFFAGLGLARDSWTSPAVWGSFAAAVVIAALLVWRQRVAEDPFILARLFRNPVFSRGAAAGFFAVIAMFCAIIYLPLFSQGVQGSRPDGAGLVLTALGVAWSTCAVTSGIFSRRVGYRWFVGIGGLFMAASFLVLIRLDADSGMPAVAAAAALLGAGLGGVISTTTLAAQNSVESSELGSATSLIQFCRNVGATLGLSLLGSVLMSVLLSKGVEKDVARTLLDPELRKSLDASTVTLYRSALNDGFRVIFWISVAVSLVAAAIGFTLPTRAQGREASETSGAPAPGSPAR